MGVPNLDVGSVAILSVIEREAERRCTDLISVLADRRWSSSARILSGAKKSSNGLFFSEKCSVQPATSVGLVGKSQESACDEEDDGLQNDRRCIR